MKNIDQIIAAQNVLEKKVEEDISEGINQLKTDLKMLLVFNDNIQEASHQIVKEATKAKVETFFKSVSSSLSMLTTSKKVKDQVATVENIELEPSSEAEMQKIEEADLKKKEEDVKMATSILNITKDISKGLAATVELGSKMEIQLEDISMAVMKKRLDSSSKATQSSVWESEELTVELPGEGRNKSNSNHYPDKRNLILYEALSFQTNRPSRGQTRASRWPSRRTTTWAR